MGHVPLLCTQAGKPAECVRPHQGPPLKPLPRPSPVMAGMSPHRIAVHDSVSSRGASQAVRLGPPGKGSCSIKVEETGFFRYGRMFVFSSMCHLVSVWNPTIPTLYRQIGWPRSFEEPGSLFSAQAGVLREPPGSLLQDGLNIRKQEWSVKKNRPRYRAASSSNRINYQMEEARK
jgi:hypothetical protein